MSKQEIRIHLEYYALLLSGPEPKTTKVWAELTDLVRRLKQEEGA